MFQFSSGNTVLQIQSLGAAQSGCTLVTTQTKAKPSAKIKRKNRVNAITVTASNSPQSGTGSTSLNDGLVYGSYPLGTRVQDKFISLNHGDVAEIHAVFESNNAAVPSAPTMVLTALNGPSAKTEDVVIGWVKAKLGDDEVKSIEDGIANQIDAQENPTTGKGKPW